MIFKGKKGMVAILLLSIFFFVIMGTLFIKLQSKKSQFNATLGETQLELIEKYTRGEQILFYIDQAAKYSIYKAIYDLNLNGGFFDYKCGDYDGYGLWESENEDMIYCLPDYKKNFDKFISTRLDFYLSGGILDIDVPLDNYDLIIEENERIKIHGIATIPLSIPILCGKEQAECGVYKVKPSFTHEIGYNFLTKFGEYTEKTKEIEKNVKECLKKGSYKPNDGDDFWVCSNEERLKQEIEGIENYEITPIIPEGDAPLLSNPDIKLHSNKVYTLLFKIEDDSFENPYSDEKLIIKYGIRFSDEFPPPATEIITDKNNKPLKKDGAWYLIWQNNASDIFGYKVYYRKIEDKLGGGEIPSSPPTDVQDMDNAPDPVLSTETKLLLRGFEEGDYYFFIIAGDDANNVANDIITKRITIPSIEEAQKEEVTDLSELFNIQ